MRERDTERKRETQRETQRETHTEKERERYIEQERDTHRETERKRDRESERISDAEQGYSLSKAKVKHDRAWSPNGWVTVMCLQGFAPALRFHRSQILCRLYKTNVLQMRL